MKRKPLIAGFLDPADAIVPCKVCGSAEGVPCKGTKPRDVKLLKHGFVHFGRRVARFLLTAGHPSKRADFERAAVKMLQEYVLEQTKSDL
jgi:hypothetical protein